jgi:Lar family restriction alleviation protein
MTQDRQSEAELEPVVTLLPCPFCGGEALVLPAYPLPKMWSIACKQCDARPAGTFTYADAANRWNTRHREAAVAEAVAKEREACACVASRFPAMVPHTVHVPEHDDISSMGTPYRAEGYTFNTARRSTGKDIAAAIRARTSTGEQS